MADNPTPTAAHSTRRDGRSATFLRLSVSAPALAVGVGFYGLCVWLYQAVAGPPGPPLA